VQGSSLFKQGCRHLSKLIVHCLFQEGIYWLVYAYDPLRCSFCSKSADRSLMIASNGRPDDQSNRLAQAEISGLVINSVLEKKKK
jgi:hypothetical protein